MKHLNFLTKTRWLLVPLMLLTLGIGQMWGTDVAYKTLTFTSTTMQTNVQNYTSSWNTVVDNFTWTLQNFNNNNRQWTAVKCGPKGDTNNTATIVSGLIDEPITSVSVTIDAIANGSITSMKLYVSSTTTFSGSGTAFTGVGSTGAKTVTIASPAANRYYKIEVVTNNTTPNSSKGKNGVASISQVIYYKAAPTPSLTCGTTSLSFEAENGSTDSKNFSFSGANLTANASISITGTNAEMFSASPTNVNKGSGTITNQSVSVTYSPTAVGEHSATLTISSTGATSKTITLSGTATAPSCVKTIALSEGSESNGTINSISSANLATCSETASERQVTITITPDDCYDAPDALTYTGNGTATMQGSKTDNGNGTFSYVYQFAQNDNGSGTFGVTCTAKAAGKTVNFDAGPGVSEETSLTETCVGSGVPLPSVDASGVCKGWGTFVGWRAAAISDSTTTNAGTLYTAGNNYVPTSDGETLYAVYSKTKGGSNTIAQLTSSEMTSNLNSSSTGYSDANETTYNDTNDGIVWSGHFNANSGGSWIQLRQNATPAYLKFSAAGNISKVEVTVTSTSNKSGGQYNMTEGYNAFGSAVNLYLSTANVVGDANANVVASATTNTTDSYQKLTLTPSSTNNNELYLLSGGGCRVWLVDVTYSTSTTYYCSDPNCCTELAPINGSFNRIHF